MNGYDDFLDWLQSRGEGLADLRDQARDLALDEDGVLPILANIISPRVVWYVKSLVEWDEALYRNLMQRIAGEGWENDLRQADRTSKKRYLKKRYQELVDITPIVFRRSVEKLVEKLSSTDTPENVIEKVDFAHVKRGDSITCWEFVLPEIISWATLFARALNQEFRSMSELEECVSGKGYCIESQEAIKRDALSETAFGGYRPPYFDEDEERVIEQLRALRRRFAQYNAAIEAAIDARESV